MPSRRQSLPPAPEVKHFRPDEIEQGLTELRRRGLQSPTERDHTNGMAGSPIVARSGFPNLGYYFAFREAARAVLARAQKVGNPHVYAYPIGALY